MNANLNALLKSNPQQFQRQDSTIDQLRDLREFAVRLGMYDAADLITIQINRYDTKVAKMNAALVMQVNMANTFDI